MEVIFSVIVPIYNVEKYIRKCVDSILAQTFEKFEVILVDDGSPDACPSICDEYALLDRRVKVIHKENGGLVAARNTGIFAAKGKYVCYVDGDDWIKEDLLQVVWEKALYEKQPDIVVFGAVKQFRDYQTEIKSNCEIGFYDKEKLAKEIYPYIMYDNRQPFCRSVVFHSAWNKIYRRELLEKHYCEETRIRMGEDSAFTFECLYAADSIFVCDEVLYIYNQLNCDSMVHSYDSKRFDNNRLLLEYIESRLGGKDNNMDMQINVLKSYWLIMAVFHEMKSERTVREAKRHIRQKIKETEVVNGITLIGLPKAAFLYILLLKVHLYSIALISARIISKFRKV